MFERSRRARLVDAERAMPFAHLLPGRRYHVVRAFVDHDRIDHPVGECWTYTGHAFLPYEDGLTLFVAMPDGRERSVRLQWRPETEGAILDTFETYVSPLPSVGGSRGAR